MLSVKPQNHIDKIISDAIEALELNCIQLGVERITELAAEFNKAGMNIESFLNMRVFIIESAKKRNKSDVLELNIRNEEIKQRNSRCLDH